MFKSCLHTKFTKTYMNSLKSNDTNLGCNAASSHHLQWPFYFYAVTETRSFLDKPSSIETRNLGQSPT